MTKRPWVTGRWTRFDRMRGAGWTMAHYDGWDARGYGTGPICGYDPHRGFKMPSPVRISDPGDGDPRCSRCERLEKVAA